MAKTEHVPHSERFNPPTFELKISLKSAEKTEHIRSLNLPEGQWLRIIQNRSPKDDISPQLELFPRKEGPSFENYKTNAYLQAIKQQN